MKILVVDDDRSSLDAVSMFLKDPLGYDVNKFSDCRTAFEMYKQDEHAIVITDIKMPGLNGLDLLRMIKKQPSGKQTDVILMTGFGDLKTCMEAIREGASDYLLKPIYISQLEIVLERLKQKRKLEQEYNNLKKNYNQTLQVAEECSMEITKWKQLYSDLIENEKIGIFSSKMSDIVDLALKYHRSRDIPFLIEGDTGTGKEIIANLIHSGGKANTQAFVELNCAAISPSLFESELFGYAKGAFTGAREKGHIGKLELAQGGTIFLDEIGELTYDLQSKLLRAIQQREIYRVGGNKKISLDVRFIFATNKSLKDKVQNGEFREDLYYRINSGYIYIPPLRERKSEIAPLAKLFLDKASQRLGKSFSSISREAIFTLEEYNFPGNVRELKNIIERICILYDEEILKTEHLSFMDVSLISEEEDILKIDLEKDYYPLKEIEYLISKKILKKFDGNVSKAAKFLNIAWATLVKIARLKD